MACERPEGNRLSDRAERDSSSSEDCWLLLLWKPPGAMWSVTRGTRRCWTMGARARREEIFKL